MKFLIAALLLLPTVALADTCPLSLSGGVEREWQSVEVVTSHSDGKHQTYTSEDELQGRWQGYVVGRAEIRPDLFLQARAIKPFEEDSHFGYAAGIEFRFASWGCRKPCLDKPVYRPRPTAKKPCK